MIYKQKKCITKCSRDFHLKKMSFHFGHTTFDILLLSPPKQATTTLLKQSYSPLSLKTSGTSSLDSVPTIIKGILKFAQIFSHFLGPIFKLVPFFSNQMPWKKKLQGDHFLSLSYTMYFCVLYSEYHHQCIEFLPFLLLLLHQPLLFLLLFFVFFCFSLWPFLCSSDY